MLKKNKLKKLIVGYYIQCGEEKGMPMCFVCCFSVLQGRAKATRRRKGGNGKASWYYCNYKCIVQALNLLLDIERAERWDNETLLGNLWRYYNKIVISFTLVLVDLEALSLDMGATILNLKITKKKETNNKL